MSVTLWILLSLIQVAAGEQTYVRPVAITGKRQGAKFTYSISYRSPSKALVVMKPFGRIGDVTPVTFGETFTAGHGEAHIVSDRSLPRIGVILSPTRNISQVTGFIVHNIDGNSIRLSHSEIQSVEGDNIYYTPGVPKTFTVSYPSYGVRGYRPTPRFGWVFVGIDNADGQERFKLLFFHSSRSTMYINEETTTLVGNRYETPVHLNLTSLTGVLMPFTFEVMPSSRYIDPSCSSYLHMATVKVLNIIQEGEQGPFREDFLAIYIFEDYHNSSEVNCRYGRRCELYTGALGLDVEYFEVEKTQGLLNASPVVKVPGKWAYGALYIVPSFSAEDEGEYILRAGTRHNQTTERRIRIASYPYY